jgi:hypothetical protein
MSPEAMRQIMDGLIAGLRSDLPGSVLGEVFDRLIWILDDNGAQLVAICREWVTGDDPRRAEAALSISDGFLFESREELQTHLAPVATRWPALAPRVDEILADWNTAHHTA